MTNWVSKTKEEQIKIQDRKKKDYCKILYKYIKPSICDVCENEILNYFYKKLDTWTYIFFQYYLKKEYTFKKIWIEFQKYELIETIALYLIFINKK